MTGSPDGYLDWPIGRTDQENRAHAVTGTGRHTRLGSSCN